MRRAVDLARLGAHTAHPNPMVGAVVVVDGGVVGEGWHRAPGDDHAEVVAISEAGGRSKGATLFVNLEPCAHQGRTPPCVEAIAAAGITKVYYAMSDPDPTVAGGGAECLRELGIEAIEGCLAEEARELNDAYAIHRTLGRPRITYKAAMTLDGRTAAPDGSSKWISGPESREAVQSLRAEADAIAVGIGTVAADDPNLTCRLDGYKGNPPVRVVFDSSGSLPAGARVVDDAAPTWIVTTEVGSSAIESRFGAEAETIVVDAVRGGVDLHQAMGVLASRGIVELLCEGGARLAGELLTEGLLDRCIVFVAPGLVCGSDGAPLFGGNSVQTIGDRIRLDFRSADFTGDDLMIVAVPSQADVSAAQLDVERSSSRSR